VLRFGGAIISLADHCIELHGRKYVQVSGTIGTLFAVRATAGSRWLRASEQAALWKAAFSTMTG
jgi:hypothetical protein